MKPTIANLSGLTLFVCIIGFSVSVMSGSIPMGLLFGSVGVLAAWGVLFGERDE